MVSRDVRLSRKFILNFFAIHHRILVLRQLFPNHSMISRRGLSYRQSLNRFKKRKLKRGISLPCSSKRLKWKTKFKSIREPADGEGEMLEPTKDEIKGEDDICQLPGIPIVPSVRKTETTGFIFVLEEASLVPAFVGRKYEILNADEHADFLRKKKMDPYKYRPDIVHDALSQIMNSRLCRAGKVQAVYVKTDQGILIKIEPRTRIPKNLRKFCAMMSELLQKFSVRARGKREKLLSAIKNPVTQYLPFNSYKIGLSFRSQKLVELEDYVATINNDVNLVFVVGAMAHGKIDSKYIDDFISVSNYPLSANTCLRRICCASERKWKIL